MPAIALASCVRTDGAVSAWDSDERMSSSVELSRMWFMGWLYPQQAWGHGRQQRSLVASMERCARRPLRERGARRVLCWACHGSIREPAACAFQIIRMSGARGSASERLRVPDFRGRLHHEPQLGQLVLDREVVALLGAGEPALRGETQLIDVDEPRGLLDPALEHVLVLELGPLGRDQAEDDDLARRD